MAEKLSELQVVVTTVNNENGKSYKMIQSKLKSKNYKSISFDLLGDLKVFKGGLDPKYSIVIIQDKLHLEAELPGPFRVT